MDLNKIISDVMNNITTLGLEVLRKSLTNEVYRDKVNKKAIEILNNVFQKETRDFKDRELLEIVLSFENKETNTRDLTRMYCTKDTIAFQRDYKEEKSKVLKAERSSIGVYIQLIKEEKNSGFKGMKFFFTEEE